MATTFGRLFGNGTIIVSKLDEVSFPASTKLTANTTAFYYPEFDEVTATSVPLRQQTSSLIANGVFNEVSGMGGGFSYVGSTFVTVNTTTDATINVPVGATSTSPLFLYIVYENNSGARPTIAGFSTLRSGNGVGVGDNASGPTSTYVLMQGTTSSSTVTIPNDATYNGLAAMMVAFNGPLASVGSYYVYGDNGALPVTKTYTYSKAASDVFVTMSGYDMGTDVVSAITLDAGYTNTAKYVSGDGAVAGRAAFTGVDTSTSTGGTILNPTAPAAGYYAINFVVTPA